MISKFREPTLPDSSRAITKSIFEGWPAKAVLSVQHCPGRKVGESPKSTLLFPITFPVSDLKLVPRVRAIVLAESREPILIPLNGADHCELTWVILSCGLINNQNYTHYNCEYPEHHSAGSCTYITFPIANNCYRNWTTELPAIMTLYIASDYNSGIFVFVYPSVNGWNQMNNID